MPVRFVSPFETISLSMSLPISENATDDLADSSRLLLRAVSFARSNVAAPRPEPSRRLRCALPPPGIPARSMSCEGAEVLDTIETLPLPFANDVSS